MGRIPLRSGDALLVQSKAEKLDSIRRGSAVAIADEFASPTLIGGRGGGGLTLIFMLVVLPLVPLLWPLR